MTGSVAPAAIQVGLFALGSPIVTGVLRKVRARLEGRQGPPVTQPLRDLRKLMGKERIASEHGSWVFSTAPLVVLGSAFLVAAASPFVSVTSPVPLASDLFWVLSRSHWPASTPARRSAGWDPAAR
jgi:formate hydrogenlyase subunit 4